MKRWETVWTHKGIEIQVMLGEITPRDAGYRVNDDRLTNHRYPTVGDAAAAIERIITN